MYTNIRSWTIDTDNVGETLLGSKHLFFSVAARGPEPSLTGDRGGSSVECRTAGFANPTGAGGVWLRRHQRRMSWGALRRYIYIY